MMHQERREGGEALPPVQHPRLGQWVRSALASALALCAGGDCATTSTAAPNLPPSTHTAVLHPGKTRIPDSFRETRKRDPSLTPHQYLTILAQTLVTPEVISRFLHTHIRYTREPRGEDHWQTAQETLERGCGDCEDFAFLAQAILALQEKTAHVLSPPGHAVCVYVERRSDGKYNSYGFDEQKGCNKNGDAYFRLRRGVGKEEPATPDGYATVLESINAISQQYDSGDLAAPRYRVQPYWIPILRLWGNTLPHEDVVSVHAFDPDAPSPLRYSGIDLAALTALLGGAYATYRGLRRKKGGAKNIKGTWKQYLTTFRWY